MESFEYYMILAANVFKQDMIMWLQERVPYDTGKLAKNLELNYVFNGTQFIIGYSSVDYFKYAMLFQAQKQGFSYLKECTDLFMPKITELATRLSIDTLIREAEYLQ